MYHCSLPAVNIFTYAFQRFIDQSIVEPGHGKKFDEINSVGNIILISITKNIYVGYNKQIIHFPTFLNK